MENLTLLTTEQIEEASYKGTLKALKVANKSPYITDIEFRKMLGGVHRNTTSKIRKSGDIAFYRLSKGIMYKESDVIAYIESYKIEK